MYQLGTTAYFFNILKSMSHPLGPNFPMSSISCVIRKTTYTNFSIYYVLIWEYREGERGTSKLPDALLQMGTRFMQKMYLRMKTPEQWCTMTNRKTDTHTDWQDWFYTLVDGREKTAGTLDIISKPPITKISCAVSTCHSNSWLLIYPVISQKKIVQNSLIATWSSLCIKVNWQLCNR